MSCRSLVLLLWLVPACAPVVAPAGPPLRDARIADGAILAADGARLALEIWPAETEPRAAIVALHGFNDYRMAFALAAEAWRKEGVETYAYDQRGFGESDIAGLWAGTETLAGDARAAVGLVAARRPGVPVFLLGDSMGGAVAAVAVANDPPPGLAGAILVAPAVWGLDTLPWSHRALLWLAAHAAPGAKLSADGLDLAPSDNIGMLRALGRDPLVLKDARADATLGLVRLMDDGLSAAGATELPILVVYGARDEIVPPEPVARFVAGLDGPVRVAVYPDGCHMALRDLRRDIPIRDIARFVLDPAAPLPSNRETPAGGLLAAVAAFRQGAGERNRCAAAPGVAEMPHPVPSERTDF